MDFLEGKVEILDDVLVGKAGSRDLLADLFLPPTKEKGKPAIVVIHGGGWMEGCLLYTSDAADD